MKTTKKPKKGKIALAVMIAALAGAIWLNTNYTTASAEKEKDETSKYLGQAEFVNASVSEESEESDYFKELRNDRKAAREEALAILEESMEDKGLSEAQKATLTEKVAALALATEKEAAIETLLKAKGIGNVLVVIGEEDVNVIVEGKLESASTVKIQDAVISQTDFSVSQIKIIGSDK